MQAIALPLFKITVDGALQVRDALDRATIDHYADVFDRLPPVVVFDTGEALLLVDGFHRMAAAHARERTHIDAVVHDGSRTLAEDYAATANATTGKPLTRQERNKAVLGFHARHPDWTQRQIADAMSVSQMTVQRLVSVVEVKSALPAETIVSATGAPHHVKDSHLMQVAAAPQEMWEPLVKEAEDQKWTVKETAEAVRQVNAIAAAPPEQQAPLRDAVKEKKWTPNETQQAVRNLADERVPDSYKERLLTGEVNPVGVTDDGHYALMAETVERELKDAERDDALLALSKACVALATAACFTPDDIVSRMSFDDRAFKVAHVPTYIAFLQDILRLAQGQTRRLEAVR